MTETARRAPETPDLVWFRGPDTIRFLNDLISQEIASLDTGSVVRSLLLGPQGKLAHLLWVLRGEDEVGLVTDPGRGGELASGLGRYRIRVDVEIEQNREQTSLVAGESLADPGRWLRRDGEVLADISWPGLPRWLVVGARRELPMMTLEEYEAARVAAGEPKWGVEIDESTIPHASGLVPETVDFTKGCFLGQELVARIDSRGGNVPWALRLLDLGDARAQAGAVVTIGDDQVGEISSAAGSLAMAMLKRGVEPGDRVTVDGAPALVKAVR